MCGPKDNGLIESFNGRLRDAGEGHRRPISSFELSNLRGKVTLSQPAFLHLAPHHTFGLGVAAVASLEIGYGTARPCAVRFMQIIYILDEGE